jgi:glutathione S-transferase
MKLYYFDIYGRAESIRFLLAHAKVEYENVNAGPIMADLKKDRLEFGQVPLFHTADGKDLVQSWAILRYLGRTYGYYPENADLAYTIDSTIDAVEDYFGAYFKFNFE